jgi:hypothetical protein
MGLRPRRPDEDDEKDEGGNGTYRSAARQMTGPECDQV